MQGTDQAGHPWLMVALMGSSLLNIGYLLPIVINAFFKKPKDDAPMRPGMPPLLAVLPPLLTAIGTFVLFLLIDPLVSYLAPVFDMEIAS